MSDPKVIRKELVSSGECQHYDSLYACFFDDGSVEVVNYKEEGEDFFDTVEEYLEVYGVNDGRD